MPAKLLYHGLGLRVYDFVDLRIEKDGIIFVVRHRDGSLRCSHCGSAEVVKRGTIKRRFRAPGWGFMPVFIEIDVQRVECLDCGLVRQVRLGFAEPRRSYTRSFERLVIELSRRMTIKDVATFLRVSWDVVKDIVKRRLQRRYSKPKLNKLHIIAIDEISIGKGHQYMTVVLDLRTGAVVFVGDGKGADALGPFWKRLRRSGAKVRAVAIDMSPAYIASVLANLPEAQIVFDHFHVVKMMNDGLAEFRRQLYRETSEMLPKKVLKGTRWLLLKNPEKLDGQRNEKRRLDEALALNRPLAMAYYMKEELRQLWRQGSKSQAEIFLVDWCMRAQHSGIRFLIKFGNTLLAHRSAILAYYDYRISTGPLEGVNNKIKTMKRQAYGFRDKEFLKLKIMAIHETKYALVG